MLLLFLICFAGATPVFGDLRFSENSLRMLIQETTNLELILTNIPYDHNRTVQLEVEFDQIIDVRPNFFTVYDGNMTISVPIRALAAGESHVTAVSSFSAVSEAFVTIQVYKSEFIEVLSIIMGWGYFLAWSISFYPQVYENYKRKSVVGLNFDFLAINLTGYFCYTAFNLGLYFIPQIKEQYSQRHPKSIISVFPNDIFFAVHGIVLTAITGLQCFWYERGDQKISSFGKGFHYVSAVILVVSAILSGCDVIQWLDFLYICSYIKLTVTICKYAPQAIMNYKRENTEGWSIEAVLLDVAGGVMSILQMFLNAYNYEKWEWILENPTKLGLGILSLLFDFIFMAQHYCLYGEARKVKKRRRQSIEDDANRTDDKVITEKC